MTQTVLHLSYLQLKWYVRSSELMYFIMLILIVLFKRSEWFKQITQVTRLGKRKWTRMLSFTSMYLQILTTYERTTDLNVRYIKPKWMRYHSCHYFQFWIFFQFQIHSPRRKMYLHVHICICVNECAGLLMENILVTFLSKLHRNKLKESDKNCVKIRQYIGNNTLKVINR